MSVNGCLCPLALAVRIRGSLDLGHLPRQGWEAFVALTCSMPHYVPGVVDCDQSPHGFLVVSGFFEGLPFYAQTSATEGEKLELGRPAGAGAAL